MLAVACSVRVRNRLSRACVRVRGKSGRRNRMARRQRGGAKEAKEASTDIKVLLKLEYQEAQAGCEKQVLVVVVCFCT